MDCHASLAETKGSHGERSAASMGLSWRAQRGHPSWRCAVMDCRASLAETKGSHGERSDGILSVTWESSGYF